MLASFGSFVGRRMSGMADGLWRTRALDLEQRPGTVSVVGQVNGFGTRIKPQVVHHDRAMNHSLIIYFNAACGPHSRSRFNGEEVVSHQPCS